MKNIIKSTALLLFGVCLLAACDDDRDANPTLQTPSTFTLNTPGYANANQDMASSDSLHFTWSQPAYGFPASVEYELQFSPDNKWTVSATEAAADASGSTVPTYGTVGGQHFECKANVPADNLSRLLEQCKLWAKDQIPASQQVSVRAAAVYNGDTIYSNIVNIKVKPYYVELKNAAPDFWYLIGNCIGDGTWGDNVGVSQIPLYTVSGATYDALTGKGIFTWTGYLTTAGFKLKHVPDSWAEQWGSSDGALTLVKNDGGSKNIIVSSDGYYTVTYDETTDKLTVVPYTKEVKDYSPMLISGDFNSWGTATDMKAFNTYSGAQNHDWVFNLTVLTDGGLKFTSGTTSWSEASFPYGAGISGGANIPVKAGTYQVFFNDITGQYLFIQK